MQYLEEEKEAKFCLRKYDNYEKDRDRNEVEIDLDKYMPFDSIR